MIRRNNSRPGQWRRGNSSCPAIHRKAMASEIKRSPAPSSSVVNRVSGKDNGFGIGTLSISCNFGSAHHSAWEVTLNSLQATGRCYSDKLDRACALDCREKDGAGEVARTDHSQPHGAGALGNRCRQGNLRGGDGALCVVGQDQAQVRCASLAPHQIVS